MPADWAGLTVEKQRADPESTLSFFRRMIEIRSDRNEFDGTQIDWLAAPADVLIFRAAAAGWCALNASGVPVPLPPGELILCSAPLRDGQLPPDAAAWLV